MAAGKPEVVDVSPRGKAKKTDNTWVIVAVLLLLLILIVFFVIPAFKGYKMYKAVKSAGISDDVVEQFKEMEKARVEAQEEASRAASEKGAVEEEAAKHQELAESYQADLDACLNSSVVKESIREELEKSYTRDIAKVRKDLMICERDFEDVLEDAAERICCSQKALGNSAITGYEVDNEKIVCVESGGTEISC